MKGKISESVKLFIFIATTAGGITLYAHEKFATNERVGKVEEKQDFQHKVSCLIAIKLKVDKKQWVKICNLDL